MPPPLCRCRDCSEQVKMIFAPLPLTQAVGATTCLASLLQHADADCCSVICDAYPRMQVVVQC